ncbi:MAG: hypothetical protein HQL41_05150 [Alphaproteobacteria bacterium]|nr:hypothetical protein [Alphaproteobacteria bacterium]
MSAFIALEDRLLRALARSPADWTEIWAITDALGALFGAKLGWTARRGPFQGIRVEGFNHPSPYLLGSYESELHAIIEDLIATAPPRIVNVGSAEGWYAAGFAKRLPAAEVIAFDIVPEQVEATRRTARENGLERRVDARLAETGPEPFAAALAPGSLVVMDCEGHEFFLLDLDAAPGLKDCAILVEVHDMTLAGLSDILLERFRPTHTVTRIQPRPRDPRDFPELAGLPRQIADLAVHEFRPEMEWFVLRPF